MVRALALVTAVVGAALAAASSAATSNTGLTLMTTYVKRHENFTREEFWKYWGTQHAPKVAPLAVHFNISRYQQIHVGGQILPQAQGVDKPASNTPVDFDGIAMFLYEDPASLTAMLSHPYYLEVIAQDEKIFIDKSAYGNGMVATFVGKQIEAVNNDQEVWVGDKDTEELFQKLFESYL